MSLVSIKNRPSTQGSASSLAALPIKRAGSGYRLPNKKGNHTLLNCEQLITDMRNHDQALSTLYSLRATCVLEGGDCSTIDSLIETQNTDRNDAANELCFVKACCGEAEEWCGPCNV